MKSTMGLLTFVNDWAYETIQMRSKLQNIPQSRPLVSRRYPQASITVSCMLRLPLLGRKPALTTSTLRHTTGGIPLHAIPLGTPKNLEPTSSNTSPNHARMSDLPGRPSQAGEHVNRIESTRSPHTTFNVGEAESKSSLYPAQRYIALLVEL